MDEGDPRKMARENAIRLFKLAEQQSIRRSLRNPGSNEHRNNYEKIHKPNGQGAIEALQKGTAMHGRYHFEDGATRSITIYYAGPSQVTDTFRLYSWNRTAISTSSPDSQRDHIPDEFVSDLLQPLGLSRGLIA